MSGDRVRESIYNETEYIKRALKDQGQDPDHIDNED